MALTRDFKQTVVNRAGRDAEFERALHDEALALVLIGEPEEARLILGDLLQSVVGLK